MATASIDTSELEYFPPEADPPLAEKSCRAKLRDIHDILNKKEEGEKELSIEEKFREIKKILKG